MFAAASTKSRRHWKKWFYVIVVTVFAGFTVIFLAESRANPAPTYNGISIKWWIEIVNGSDEMSKGLAEIGPETIPYFDPSDPTKGLAHQKRLSGSGGNVDGTRAGRSAKGQLGHSQGSE